MARTRRAHRGRARRRAPASQEDPAVHWKQACRKARRRAFDAHVALEYEVRAPDADQVHGYALRVGHLVVVNALVKAHDDAKRALEKHVYVVPERLNMDVRGIDRRERFVLDLACRDREALGDCPRHYRGPHRGGTSDIDVLRCWKVTDTDGAADLLRQRLVVHADLDAAGSVNLRKLLRIRAVGETEHRELHRARACRQHDARTPDAKCQDRDGRVAQDARAQKIANVHETLPLPALQRGRNGRLFEPLRRHNERLSPRTDSAVSRRSFPLKPRLRHDAELAPTPATAPRADRAEARISAGSDRSCATLVAKRPRLTREASAQRPTETS